VLTVMVFEKRYIPLLRWANQLAVANIVHHGMPVFNSMAITTMVDRRSLETHSFHLPCSEMTGTLEDVDLILGLPIRGRPITGRVESSTWCERVAGFIGQEPPVKLPGV
jgi:hypothetical protein